MIRPSLALISLFFYSLALGLSSALSPALILPLFFLGWCYQGAWKAFFKRLLFLNLFVLMVIASLVLAQENEQALLIFLRSNAIISLALLLFHGKDAFAIAFGIQQLKAPKKLSSLFFFTAKFIFLIKEEFSIFKQTLKSRGFSPKTSLFTYQTYANFVGMLIIKALRRANKLEYAMRLRGFNGELYSLNGSTPVSWQEVTLMCVLFISIVFHLGAFV